MTVSRGRRAKPQEGLPLALEFGYGQRSLASGESLQGAQRFSAGAGRHGAPD